MYEDIVFIFDTYIHKTAPPPPLPPKTTKKRKKERKIYFSQFNRLVVIKLSRIRKKNAN
jgi:hypothetical protein